METNTCRPEGSLPAVCSEASFKPRCCGSCRFHPSYNLSPGRYTPILRNAWKPTDASEPNEASGPPKAGAVDSPERFIQCMKWGLVPSFTKKEEKPDFFRMVSSWLHERRFSTSGNRVDFWDECCLHGVPGWHGDLSRRALSAVGKY